MFGFVDDFRLVAALIMHDQWTVGSDDSTCIDDDIFSR